ncbi:hypothetical protein LguiA_014603 [Lonicera macranthoides]
MGACKHSGTLITALGRYNIFIRVMFIEVITMFIPFSFSNATSLSFLQVALLRKSPYVHASLLISILSVILCSYTLFSFFLNMKHQDNDLSEFDESREVIESLVDEYKACKSPDYVKWAMEAYTLLGCPA